MKLKKSIDKYMLKNMKKNDLSGIITYLLTFLLNNFVSFLEKEGIENAAELKPKHIDKYYNDYLSCYQYHLHETIWDFFSFIKKKRSRQ